MESNAKYIVYLNIFLLTIHLSYTEEVISSTAPELQQSTTIASNILRSTQEIIVTTSLPFEDATQIPIPITDTNTNADENTTEGSQDVIQPDTLEELLHNQEDVEMEDLQHGGNFKNIPKTINEDDEVILPLPIDNDKEAPRWETEWIEEEFEDKEDEDVPPFVEVMTAQAKAQSAFEGHLMGIIVASFLITFLVTGYVALIGWRRFIHKRYGSRQILVNEEDMIIDPNDMKHFSL